MKWVIFSLIVLVVVGLTAWIWFWLADSRRAQNEKEAVSVLKGIASAEADFRNNDRDGKGINDFWTGDVAGLYYVLNPITRQPVALIGEEVAQADSTSLRKNGPGLKPKAGYYFAAMDWDDTYEGSAYALDTRGISNLGPYYNSSKFAFCAFPADYPRSGLMTFVMDEGNRIFRLDTGGKPLLRWPSDHPRCARCGGPGHSGLPCGSLH